MNPQGERWGRERLSKCSESSGVNTVQPPTSGPNLSEYLDLQGIAFQEAMLLQKNKIKIATTLIFFTKCGLNTRGHQMTTGMAVKYQVETISPMSCEPRWLQAQPLHLHSPTIIMN